MSSNESKSNSLGLSGLPPAMAQTASEAARPSSDTEQHVEDQSTIPTVNVEFPTESHRPSSFRRSPLGSKMKTSSETDLADPDKLSALPSNSTFPRRNSGVSLPAPTRAATHPPPSDEFGRRSTESEPTPRHSRTFDSPKLKSAVDALRSLGSRVNDPGHTSAARATSPPRNSPRWPFIPLHLSRSRQDPFYPRDPYQSDFDSLMRQDFRASNWFEHFIRQAMRHFLLRLPSTYFTRVRRIFESAEVSKHEIEKMIDERACGAPFPREWNLDTVSPSVLRFRTAWEEFIDSVLKEWKTLNIVSALLTTGILTLFQIEEAANDPVTRTSALLSMVCALMSLIYGCTYILRFGTMRSMEKAIRWAQEMQQSTTSVFWNVWVLLATPAAWLAWSMIFFCIAMLSFIWRTGTTSMPQPLTPQSALAPRVFVTVVFGLGVVVFVAVVRTFRTWGDRRGVVVGPVHNSPDAFTAHELKPENRGTNGAVQLV